MPNSLNTIVLGFDWGSKRIGVAVGNDLLNHATPLKTLAAKAGVPDWLIVSQLINEWRPHILVVGVPLDMDGKALPTTKRAEAFCSQLKERFKLPLYSVDERLTTVEARQQLFDEGGYRKIQSAQVDSYAAKLIVEQWLLNKSYGGE
jgi:putative Holliday junction resolvase